MRERKKNTDFTYMWNQKNKTNKKTKQKQTHSYRKKTGARGYRGVGG